MEQKIIVVIVRLQNNSLYALFEKTIFEHVCLVKSILIILVMSNQADKLS